MNLFDWSPLCFIYLYTWPIEVSSGYSYDVSSKDSSVLLVCKLRPLLPSCDTVQLFFFISVDMFIVSQVLIILILNVFAME